MLRAGALLLTGMLALSACSQEPDDTRVVPTEVPSDVIAVPPPKQVTESQYGTPIKDRVATLGLLNKRNNLSQDIKLKPGEARRIDNVIVRLATCERTLPWEQPSETGAFVQVFVQERADSNAQLAWHKVFSGWLFKNAPSLSVVEHPVYDVWVKDCAMNFPGEEDGPAASASASSAAKASGSATTAPRPSPSPSTKPSASAKAAPAATPTAGR